MDPGEAAARFWGGLKEWKIHTVFFFEVGIERVDVEFEDFEVSSEKQTKKDEKDIINLSINIIKTLKGKMKDHNKKAPIGKTSLSQLKKYLNTAHQKFPQTQKKKIQIIGQWLESICF